MKKFYVVGNKTSKSLSPTIFNYWFKKYSIDAKYEFLELSLKIITRDYKYHIIPVNWTERKKTSTHQ